MAGSCEIRFIAPSDNKTGDREHSRGTSYKENDMFNMTTNTQAQYPVSSFTEFRERNSKLQHTLTMPQNYCYLYRKRDFWGYLTLSSPGPSVWYGTMKSFVSNGMSVKCFEKPIAPLLPEEQLSISAGTTKKQQTQTVDDRVLGCDLYAVQHLL